MGPAAFLATPGVGTAIGAGLSGFFGWLGSRSQAKATRQAADIQARAARTTGAWQERVAGEQLDFQREEAARLQGEFNRAERANWAMERAREQRLYGQAGDTAFNRFALSRQQGRMGFEETAANRANLRAELLSAGRTGQGRFAATQRRIGRLGALMGAPQPPGGREIAPYVEPTALVQPEWVPLADPRQTAFEYPDYVPPTTEV
jgi:hypothetical protein